MVQPAVPSIPSGGPRPPDQAAVNRQLQQLYQYWYKRDTGVAQSILRYIQSGWTTSVDPQVQQAISTLVGRQVPATGTNAAAGMFNIPGGGNNGQPLYPPGGGGLGERTPLPANAPAAPGGGAPPPSPVVPPLPGSSIASLFANSPGAPAYANPGTGIWPDQPPQATGTGYQGQGGAQAVPDPNVLPVTGKGSSFFNTPPAAYSPPPTGPTGAASYGSETAPVSSAVAAGQRAGATATQPGGARPGGGQTVNPPGFTPAPGSPLTTSAGGGTGAFGAIDPTSAIGQQGYTQAQAGDPTALSAVLTSILGKFGIDVNRGGIFTPGLVSSLAPYLKTVMEYGGLANGGKPVIPSQLADQFGGMVGGANTFGQIQDFAKGLLPTLGGLLSAPAGALADSGNQAGVVNDILGMLTAGANPLYQQYQQGVNKKTLSDYVQSQLGGPTQNYIDWMRQNATKVPGSDLLAQIIGASR